MTREQCQQNIAHLLKAAFEIFKAFDPEADHLSAYATERTISVTGYKGEDMDKVLDYTEYPVGAKFDRMTEESA